MELIRLTPPTSHTQLKPPRTQICIDHPNTIPNRAPPPTTLPTSALNLNNCWKIPKSHIDCLSPWSGTYISIGQLHLMPIGFKMKSNMISEQTLILGPRFCQSSFGQLHIMPIGFNHSSCHPFPNLWRMRKPLNSNKTPLFWFISFLVLKNDL